MHTNTQVYVAKEYGSSYFCFAVFFYCFNLNKVWHWNVEEFMSVADMNLLETEKGAY